MWHQPAHSQNRLPAALLAILWLLAPLAAAAQPAATVEAVRSALSDDSRQALPIENYRIDLIRYYAAPDAGLLFAGTPRAEHLIERMRESGYDGLDPQRYPVDFLEGLLDHADGASPEELAEVELWFAAHFLMFAADMKVGRVLPRMVYPELYMPRKAIDGENVMRALSRFPDVESFFVAWEPFNPEYRSLRKALKRYVDIRENGGWGTIEPGADVAPGGTDPRIPALRARLALEYPADGQQQAGDPGLLDPALAETLRAFQLHHDLPATGNLDTTTLLALNVPVDRRIEQIALAMERLRWMPEDIGDRVLVANKGDGLLRLLDESGGVARAWRILPNCPRDNLAIVAGRMRTMVINPSWDVPYDYFQSILFPLLQQNPADLQSRGYELLYLDAAMPLDALPWRSFPKSTLARDKDKFRLRLKPGAENPYGRFVYRLDGIDEAFLFDAPPDAAAEICDPRLPKGAIAVIEGLDLVDLFVRRPLGPDDYLERTLARRDTLIVPDIEPLPLMIVFQSAWIDPNGNLRFSKDPNLEDLRLVKALEGREAP